MTVYRQRVIEIAVIGFAAAVIGGGVGVFAIAFYLAQ